MSLSAAPDVPIETKTVTYQIGDDTFEGCVSPPGQNRRQNPRRPRRPRLDRLRPVPQGPRGTTRQARLHRPRARHVRPGHPRQKPRGSGQTRRGVLSRTPPCSASARRPRWRNCSSSPAWTLTRIGAIGFCFGGATVLELARSGANVRGGRHLPRLAQNRQPRRRRRRSRRRKSSSCTARATRWCRPPTWPGS